MLPSLQGGCRWKLNISQPRCSGTISHTRSPLFNLKVSCIRPTLLHIVDLHLDHFGSRSDERAPRNDVPSSRQTAATGVSGACLLDCLRGLCGLALIVLYCTPYSVRSTTYLLLRTCFQILCYRQSCREFIASLCSVVGLPPSARPLVLARMF